MSHYNLEEKIVELSVSDDWEDAKYEWSIFEIYIDDTPATCLCGHFPILEMCVLQNRLNGKFTTVGNVCVHKFMGLPSDAIFASIKRIMEDSGKAFGYEGINFAFHKSWITDWERNFCEDTARKRKLTRSQKTKRIEINEKIIRFVQSAKPCK